MVGLGIQAPKDGTRPALAEGMLRLLRAVAARSRSISVRGATTAEVLGDHGIRDVRVTGCPSLMWHVDRPARVARRPAMPGRICVNGTRYDQADVLQPGSRSEAGVWMMRFARHHRLDYVAQSEVPDLTVARGEGTAEERDRFLGYLCRVYADRDAAALAANLRAHMHIFADVPSWLDFLAGKDLVIGTRLHGVIAGLLAGVPGVLVTHDARTAEMAAFAGIPAIDAARLMAGGPAALRDMDGSFEAFNSRQVQIARTLAAFLDENDVAHRLAPA
jgi:hypothetical protein